MPLVIFSISLCISLRVEIIQFGDGVEGLLPVVMEGDFSETGSVVIVGGIITIPLVTGISSFVVEVKFDEIIFPGVAVASVAAIVSAGVIVDVAVAAVVAPVAAVAADGSSVVPELPELSVISVVDSPPT
ncbi:unnamed protein product [[Candida] boidinii]|nr:unnamed protein product [[Candida] boidinii]